MSALPFGTGRGRCRFESDAMGPCGIKGSLKTGQENGSGSVQGTLVLHYACGRVADNRTPDLALGFFNRCGRRAPVPGAVRQRFVKAKRRYLKGEEPDRRGPAEVALTLEIRWQPITSQAEFRVGRSRFPRA